MADDDPREWETIQEMPAVAPSPHARCRELLWAALRFMKEENTEARSAARAIHRYLGELDREPTDPGRHHAKGE